MTVSIAVVCEAAADQRTGCDLADRVFCEQIAWLEAGLLDHVRTWRGFQETERFLRWDKVRKHAETLRIRSMHGHFRGEPGELHAAAARRAMLVLLKAACPPDAIVFLLDDDRLTQRRQGLEQSRTALNLAIPVVIGLAHAMRECWVLAGFTPQDEGEEIELRELRRELGFDPCENAGLLTAKHEHDKRSAKRVLRVLAGADGGREAECWTRMDLNRLRQRGKESGLSDYLEEVARYLVPLLTSSRGVGRR